MILLIDVGNTRIKSATLIADQLTPLQPIVWRANPAPQHDFDARWHHLEPDAVLISNVGGREVGGSLSTWMREVWPSVAPEFVTVSGSLGHLHCAYPEPDKLGVDRWVAIRGAVARFPAQPVLVLDIGTAGTSDLVSAQGVHLGGAIFPGIGTMRRALAGDTAQLNVPAGDVTPFANNTPDAIAGGTAYALAGALARFVSEAQQRCGADALEIVLTGGEAGMIAPLLHVPTCLAPDLVLEGLAEIVKEKL